MDSVVQLVNRLQSAATKLGDNAASDKSLPSLWELLPSIVVIGGQVCGLLPVRAAPSAAVSSAWSCAVWQLGRQSLPSF